MRKAMDVVGLPVFSLETGEEIGVIRDILVDSETWLVLGVLLSEQGWFQSGTYIPYDRIHAVGESCLTVSGEDAITSLEQLAAPEPAGIVTGKGKLKGKSVISVSGDLLGRLEDVYFSADWEKIVGYELSNGWLADVTEGRKRLSVPPSVIIGEENLIVPD
ncbi:PRC-barrel domain-containing protein [Brevibacillus composti]|uniref:PRC-barrel domain-containing protein n=1 Tax=Brevibacillus composti TaxID=2796470 RepID=A0A7T5EIG5_9BACL|nr:PRC-barrel domain-containing protein [Brevibacillus composti]QQE73236.1 PRC-barrel domain-containing protein [Brevibacillus composti]QUO40317.1 PRC-barrel domain-containing protein [Brevibacillus composti]